MSKWLAKQLQKDPATVSKWCNNHSQPDLYPFVRIANSKLDVDVRELICHTKNSGLKEYRCFTIFKHVTKCMSKNLEF